jgi:hypothetical protein
VESNLSQRRGIQNVAHANVQLRHLISNVEDMSKHVRFVGKNLIAGIIQELVHENVLGLFAEKN